MENTIIIGEVLKPQGIRGELKVRPFTDDVSRFKKLKKVIIDGVEYVVLGCKIACDSIFLSISGINDRNAAEGFRGKFLHVLREDAIVPDDGRYLIVDIIGCALFDGENHIATITDVTSARTDIICALTKDGRTIRFPFLKDAVEQIDVQNKVFKVNSKRFKEIALYEN